MLTAFGGSASLAGAGFLLVQARATHPMVPLDCSARRTCQHRASCIGFAFMVGYYGLPFVFSLYFQSERGLSSLGPASRSCR